MFKIWRTGCGVRREKRDCLDMEIVVYNVKSLLLSEFL
jgi:hypothetical protein